MKTSLGVLALWVLPLAVHGEDDTQAQLKLIQDRLLRLTELVEGQQKTIQEQQKKIDQQERKLAAVTTTGGIAKSPVDLTRRVEKAEMTVAQAVKIASRKK